MRQALTSWVLGTRRRGSRPAFALRASTWQPTTNRSSARSTVIAVDRRGHAQGEDAPLLRVAESHVTLSCREAHVEIEHPGVAGEREVTRR